MKRQVGQFTENIINKLELEIAPGTPIFISDSNIEHMKSSLPEDYDRYFDRIERILNNEVTGFNIGYQRTERAAVTLVGDVGTVTPPDIRNQTGSFGCPFLLRKRKQKYHRIGRVIYLESDE